MFICFVFTLTLILDVCMMMTRSRTRAAATADAVTLSNYNPMVIVNKQAQTQSHHILRGRIRSPSSSPPTSSRRSRSQVVKKVFNKNDNISGTNLFLYVFSDRK